MNLNQQLKESINNDGEFTIQTDNDELSITALKSKFHLWMNGEIIFSGKTLRNVAKKMWDIIDDENFEIMVQNKHFQQQDNIY